MKKIFMALMLCLVSICGFGQLNVQSKEDYTGYKIVDSGFGWEIRYITSNDNNHGYYFLGVTDNKFENTMASVFLGIDKESSIKTIEDLANVKNIIKENGGEIVVRGMNNKATTIFIGAFGSPYMKTDGVAGNSAGLSIITTSNKARESIIDKINIFIE